LAAEVVDEVAFLELLFLVVVVRTCRGFAVHDSLARAELSVASTVLLSFERDFFVVAVSAPVVLFPGDSGAAVLLVVEPSAASAVLLALEALFLAFAVELSNAAPSVLAAAFSLDLEVVVFAESAVASAVLCKACEAAAFFLVFFFVVALVSVWSVELEDPDCCAARAVTLPKISSAAATKANTIPLLVFILLSPSARVGLQPSTLLHIAWWFGCFRHAVRAFLAGMRSGGSQG
jgi:hypothetical protein